jgi:23S rRNA (guanosine2251-2'-O)-methyltransferase
MSGCERKVSAGGSGPVLEEARERRPFRPKSKARLIVSSSRRRNDRHERQPRPVRQSSPRHAADGLEWIWGRHAVEAALANPRRSDLRRLVLAPGKALPPPTPGAPARPAPQTLDTRAIAELLPRGAVHQGYALFAAPLAPVGLDEIAVPAKGVILMLDQVTDPQNIGAILRSAAAFGARGVVLQDRHAPPLSGALAKAAAGAVDKVPAARVVNLSRALERLAELGWRSVGLDGSAQTRLESVLDSSATVLVLGSEGEGLRRLVAEHCDTVARIPMPGDFASLNVASAAAVALYEATKLAQRGNELP